ncbi:MAG: amidohydrolase family protein [Faecalibacterium sp.]|nr:amidohydrolase family protein [Ruminococcus sp.]MCM1391393.1 amidohydrolase family protein [Ruminococcus sp.]MCM1484603.1 amidohydrolase family protein [Faecalibacterium sp.]
MNKYQIRSRKIDCHTHIFNSEIKDEYFSRTSGYALVMQLPEYILNNSQCIETVMSDDRLFLNPCVDLKQPILPQLEIIEQNIEKWKVVGLKIYLSYQTAKASDKLLYPIYEFADKHGLSVTFHTGLCSLILPSDNDIDGSDAKYIETVAEKFPNVNFIIAHMDDPRFDECIRIVAAHDNLFTDFSGAYETGTKEGNDVDGAIATFGKAIHSQSGTERKILYGTDFCPPINLGQLDEYDYSIEKIFDEKDFPLVYFENCLRAFPKLKKYIKGCDKEI